MSQFPDEGSVVRNGQFKMLRRNAVSHLDGAIQVFASEGAPAENIEVRGGFAEVGENGLTVLAERVEG